ncbi:MAG: hypothetical protein IT174_11315 [Acidobacteria bacterium]|nr:hypothetical protein [Acidobacteriota bacterium]
MSPFLQKFWRDYICRLKESAEYRGDNTAIEDSDISKATNRFTSNTTYDAAGQVVSDNKFRSMSFAYDANGRQIKATRSGLPDAWTVYDAGGNRVATKIDNIWRYMVYDAMGKLVAEYGEMSDGVGGVKYVQQDWQGSVRTVTNANGFVVARTDHQAFGGEVGYGTGQRSIDQGYNRDAVTRQGYGLTERDDATGLDHTWFRKNESSAGRWTSPDPYKGSMNLGDPQSFNRYSYVQNQPTNFVDPSGLFLAGPDTHYGPAIQGYGIFNAGLAGMMYMIEQALQNVAFDIFYEVDSDGNVTTSFQLFVPSEGSTIAFMSSSGFDSTNMPSAQASDFDGRGSPGVITNDEMARYRKERDDARQKMYNDCVEGETRRILNSPLIQGAMWKFLADGLQDHFGFGAGVSTFQGLLEAAFGALKNSKLLLRAAIRGGIAGFLLGQVPSFKGDADRADALASQINSQLDKARSKCRRLIFGG